MYTMIVFKKRSSRGFTLVELMIVVAIIGILAALAIAGVRKYMTSAKSAEARNSIGTISGLASGVWTSEKMKGAILPDGGTIGATHNLCDSAPLTPTTVPKGVKYQSAAADGSDYHTGDSYTGWKCLGFALDAPQYFSYQYKLAGTFAAPTGFDASAQGDLNADTKTSLFNRTASIVGNEIKLGPSIDEYNADE